MEYVWLIAGFVLLIVGVLSLIFAKTNKRFSRPEGAVMLAIYAIYFIYVLLG